MLVDIPVALRSVIVTVAARRATGMTSRVPDRPLTWQTTVGEQYQLDREREARRDLCGERKTLERIQPTLKTGKPVRNKWR